MPFHPRDTVYYKTLNNISENVLSLLSCYNKANTFFLSVTDRSNNHFVKVLNNDSMIINEQDALLYEKIISEIILEIDQDILNISNLSQHPLMKNHPILNSLLGEGSLLAIPLYLPEENVVVTLCVIDHNPYEYTENDINLIKILGQYLINTLKLENLTIRDPLTGLYNRNFVNLFLDHHFQEPSKVMALIYFDLDRFKLINDTYGHQYGDKIIQEVARRLEECVASLGIACRMGGDEFLIILEELDKTQYLTTVKAISRFLLEEITTPVVIEGEDLKLETSIGISIYPLHGTDMSTLLKKADIAMYKSKNNHSHYEIYEHDQGIEISHKITIERGLRKALERDEFKMYFQPLYNMSTEKIMGMEALIRWIHPEKGFISPNEFIRVAEETGLIVPIGDWVIKDVCLQAKKWLEHGNPPVIFSINISSEQFKSFGFVERVIDILKETNFDPNLLNFEITETVLMENINTASDVIKKLKSIGISFSIDDFGTGYSSLGYLRHLPIDCLKIDRTFIQEITEHYGDQAIVRALITLGKELGMSVVAEGVEEETQHKYLKDRGCSIGQGYFYHRPVPMENIIP